MNENFIQTSGELFEAVQLSGIFKDSKTFVDSTPKSDPELILADYLDQKDLNSFDLEAFIKDNFVIPGEQDEEKIPEFGSMDEHIDHLWEVLSRQPDEEVSEYSTLIPLPHPYIVPGGRFREIYYWDTYFTSLGLAESGHIDKVKDLARNFAYQVTQFGHIPNGNRVYFLSRSQPPFLSMMVDLITHYEKDAYKEFIPALEKEYQFWMEKRYVDLPDGMILTRYFDDNPVPREESFKEDHHLQKDLSPDDSRKLMQHIRAACESGWDFSSRWFTDSTDLTTIRTADLIPVDLNALIYSLESKLAKWTGKDIYIEAYKQTRFAFDQYFWDDKAGFYFDYDFKNKEKTKEWTLAAAFPLFMNISTDKQAASVATHLKDSFLKPGGLVTTLHETGQQWDAPNGWAPLQWVCVQGLLNYGFDDLAKEIATRWVQLNDSVYKRTGKMMEKYNVADLSLHAGGGEYDLQDGFGWSNGVVVALKKKFNL